LEESCALVGLFHDVGKIGMPGTSRYIKNTNVLGDQALKYGLYDKPRGSVYGLAARGLYLPTNYIPLSGAEAQGILYHDGQYVGLTREVAHQEEPLTLLANWADYWTAHIDEEGRRLKDDTDHYDRV
jgi:hypothetical protein